MDHPWIDERDMVKELVNSLQQGKFKKAWMVCLGQFMRRAYGENWNQIHPQITLFEKVMTTLGIVLGLFLCVCMMLIVHTKSSIALAFTDKGIFRETVFALRWMTTDR